MSTTMLISMRIRPKQNDEGGGWSEVHNSIDEEKEEEEKEKRRVCGVLSSLRKCSLSLNMKLRAVASGQ